MPRARAADVKNVLAELLQHRLHLGEGLVVGADHAVELPFLGVLRRARERRVDDAPFSRSRRGYGRWIRASRSSSRLRSAPCAPLEEPAVHIRLDLRRSGDAQDDAVRNFGELARGLTSFPPGRASRRGSRGCGARGTRARDLSSAGFRHAVAHEAQPDESDRLHLSLIFRFARRPRPPAPARSTRRGELAEELRCLLLDLEAHARVARKRRARCR